MDNEWPPPPPRRPRIRRSTLITIGVVVAVVSTSTVLSKVVGDAAGSFEAAPASAISAETQPFYTQKLHWNHCDSGLLCTTVSEPLDWFRPSGPRIDVALVKHPASGTRTGSLLVDPGGPGGSGTAMIEDSVLDAVDSTIARHFDVIGFDPRGVGASTPVTCYDSAGMDRYLYGILPGPIGSDRWIAADIARARAYSESCAENTGHLLAEVDSISVARDMDVIRAALGESRLNYLGYSYGSYLGTLYAGLFPTRVGRFVFDGAEDPWSGSSDDTPAGLSPFEGDEDMVDTQSLGSGQTPDVAARPAHPDTSQAVGFENALRSFVSACTHSRRIATDGRRCAVHGTVDQGMGEIKALLGRVAAHPLRASDGRLLGDATLAVAITGALYTTDTWPDLNDALRAAARGRADAAFSLADDYNDRDESGRYEDQSTVAGHAVDCLEYGSEFNVIEMRQAAEQFVHDAPVLGIYEAYGDADCAYWPYGPSFFPTPIHAPTAGPILVVGTTRDPATPYEDAVALSRQLRSAHLVTFDGDGHTAYAKGNDCVDGAVDDYLLHGALPAADPHCS
ncbi:alpha/beta hydrolase [Galbitalea soli]|uniref:Alpha/beta hydrolase n=1 Tax=Galbitalea soli TaxID=1268042 RepID=A0A7C9TNM5_9MICO|nr:alpha/beta hydrolase [Galbitalea soli]NEM90317.1 alpha/beta hydrolase [Galbitalea soli]NYJ31025.1 pimeloyl-ACP methyl ester carboxylesterase [Galbitalea soli]